MAVKQYYLLNKPTDISGSSYQTYPCENRFFEVTNNSNKLFNYNQLYNYEIAGSVPSSDSYKDRYIYNRKSFIRFLNNHIINEYKTETVMPILYLYDIDTPGDGKYFDNYSDELFGISGLILVPNPNQWLRKYQWGDLYTENSSHTPTWNSPWYLEWYKTNATTGVIHAKNPSGNTISAISTNGTTNFVFQSVHEYYNTPYKGYFSFKLGISPLFYNFHYDSTDLFYIGSSSDYISFRPVLILNDNMVTDSSFQTSHRATYGFPKTIGFSTSTISIGHNSQLTIDLTWSGSENLSVTNGSVDYNLMDAFDTIMASKYGSNYNTTNHTLYTNGVTHYFYVTDEGIYQNDIIFAAYYSELVTYIRSWVFTKYTSSAEDMGCFSCAIIDCYKYNNIYYVVPFGIIAMDNLTYNIVGSNSSIPNQSFGSICDNGDYPGVTFYDIHYYNYRLFGSEAEEKEVRYKLNLSDHTQFNDTNTNSSYWCNYNTFDYDWGFPLLENTSYAYAYNG